MRHPWHDRIPSSRFPPVAACTACTTGWWICFTPFCPSSARHSASLTRSRVDSRCQQSRNGGSANSAGLWAERVGERNLLALGTAAAGAGFIGLGFPTGFVSLLVFIFLAGLGAAFQHPLASSLITGAFPAGGRRAALGTYNSFGDVGKFMFMGLTILATGIGMSWQVPVIGYGITAVITAVACLVLLRMAGSGDQPTVEQKERAANGAKGWGIRHRGGFLSLGAIAALDNSTRNGFLTFLAFLMIEKGIPTGWAASAVLITLLGGMLGKFACGMLAERIGITRTIAITEIGTGLGILLILAAQRYTPFSIASTRRLPERHVVGNLWLGW